MPTYEYVCDACTHNFELRQGFHDKPVDTCPKCQEIKVRRVICAAPVIFKGSGFYVTDSRPAPKEESAATATPAPAAAAAPAASAPAAPAAETKK